MALIAWPDADANSYSSRADAEAYLGDMIGFDVWNNSTDTVKDASLVTMTRALDKLSWEGEKTAADQPLAFPRTGLTDAGGTALADDTIPTTLLQALWEGAAALVSDETIYGQQSSSSNVRRVQAGTASVEYWSRTKGGRFPPNIQTLIQPLLAGNTNEPYGIIADSNDLDDLRDEIRDGGFHQGLF